MAEGTVTRRALLRAGLGIGALAVVGCGDGGEGGDGGDGTERTGAGTDRAPAGGAGFPVTIRHALGTTEIPALPRRVVALSEADQDGALLLGMAPVGMVKLFGPDGIAPWTAPSLPVARPELLDTAGGTPFDAVAALHPDVILSNSSPTVDDDYGTLSGIAPTTAYRTGPGSDRWQEVLLQVGTALGRADQARTEVDRLESALAGVATGHPELRGRTFAVVSVIEPGRVGVLRSTDDATVRLLEQFGMILSPSVAALAGDGPDAPIGYDQLEVLDVDVLIAHHGAPERRAELENEPRFTGLDAYGRGSYVVADEALFRALRSPTGLSLPYVVDRLVPELARAAALVGGA
jgi:iron complex transport system substrate-binding protein